jgi:hypothetical protein
VTGGKRQRERENDGKEEGRRKERKINLCSLPLEFPLSGNRSICL